MNPTIKYMFSEQWGIMTLSTNNQVSETYFNSFTNPVISPTDSYTQEITYNSDNYPTEIKRYRVSDNTLVSDLSFQYR
ncbi:MAG: hypothetical protein EOO48_11575 [Flavobacterium sp.]|nr:MAG: hypothetical protein EOO48_11575 [Flavobacterium sp.]